MPFFDRAPFDRAPSPASEPSRATGFSGNRLDRRSEARDGVDPIALMGREDAVLVVFAGEKAVVRLGDAPTLRFGHAEAERFLLGSRGAPVLLGFDGDAPWLAIEVGPETQLPDPLKPIDLRSLAVQSLVSADEQGAAAQARSLLGWHAAHGFCARCGERTTIAAAGAKRVCAGCGAEHFPRVDPVVIMLAIRGDRCVLGRQPRFAPGMFSCLAGFVEPGETIEDAVRRETREEAGIAVGRVRYHASQPWPFLSSLMIGCHAEALEEALTPDGTELEACRWFDRAEVRTMLAGSHPDGLALPPRMAIAHHLIRSFADPD